MTENLHPFVIREITIYPPDSPRASVVAYAKVALLIYGVDLIIDHLAVLVSKRGHSQPFCVFPTHPVFQDGIRSFAPTVLMSQSNTARVANAVVKQYLEEQAGPPAADADETTQTPQNRRSQQTGPAQISTTPASLDPRQQPLVDRSKFQTPERQRPLAQDPSQGVSNGNR